jgi:2-oxoacid:acceptor oxidoreductase delta subunit (pyruvate/2-ketoisovalerate family)
MGMERYEYYNRNAKNVLVHECGWSLENKTGSWRSKQPVLNPERCNLCSFCWLYCPDGAISRTEDGIVINLEYCKGCGICSAECPKDAIEMVREEE